MSDKPVRLTVPPFLALKGFYLAISSTCALFFEEWPDAEIVQQAVG